MLFLFIIGCLFGIISLYSFLSAFTGITHDPGGAFGVGVLMGLIAIVLGYVFPSSCIRTDRQAAYYHPLQISRNVENVNATVSYIQYDKCKKASDWETYSPLDVKPDMFNSISRINQFLNGGDFTRLVLIAPDSNVVVRVEWGKTIFGKWIAGSTILQCLSDAEMANIEINEDL